MIFVAPRNTHGGMVVAFFLVLQLMRPFPACTASDVLHETQAVRTSVKAPVRIPTKSPVRIPIITPVRIPIKSPVRIPIKTPTRIPVQPPLESPTSRDAGCINSARLVDVNGDKKFTIVEYAMFLQNFTQCTSIMSNDSYVMEVFSLTQCFPNPVGCTTNATLDISSFYIPTNVRATVDDAEIIKVCDFAEGVRDLFLYCGKPSSTPVPIATPRPTPRPITTVPVSLPPTNCGLFGLNFFCLPRGKCGFFRQLFAINGC